MSDLYGLIGNPLSHSKSPMIHGVFASDNKQEMTYSAIEAATDAFAARVEQFRAEGGKGLNVTAPFKVEACEYATNLSERARLAGAVNALRFDGDQIHADNFDGVGLVNDIQRNLGVALQGKRVLLLGAGGAARGAILPILEQLPTELVVANRTLARAEALQAQFGVGTVLQVCGFQALAGRKFDVVLNATSASLRGELPAIPADIFRAEALAYELVYGKGLTPFLRLAKAAGVSQLADGVGMLVEQAAEAFLWWRGVRPDTTPMITALKIPLV